MKVAIESRKNKQRYAVRRFSELYVETNLDIPADFFQIVIENPLNEWGKGINAGRFAPNDQVIIEQENTQILRGITDEVRCYWDDVTSKIEMDGRDYSQLLLDNSAEPRTYNQLSFGDYMKTIATPYGFSKFRVNSLKDQALQKITVEPGDSQWDTLHREARRLGMWLWCMPDGTLVADELNYGSAPLYRFSNEESDSIKIKKLDMKEDGTYIRGEVWVRGYGQKTFLTKYQHQGLIDQGFDKRRIIETNAKNSKEAETMAKRFIEETLIGNYEIQITVNGKHSIEVNQTAYVKDKITGIEGVFFYCRN